MVKIRKKTSRRTPTRLREKIKHKAAEHQRKAKKNAKKDVTWHSNKPKEIGIPSQFPYKEQVIAEMQAAKELELEERRQRREAATVQGGAMMGTIASAAAVAQAAAVESEAESEDDDASADPSLRLHAKSLRKVLELADVVIEVLDARDPVNTRCRAVERQLRSLDGGRKKLVVVLNKIDLVPPDVVQAWLAHLRRQGIAALPFKSSTQEQRKNLKSEASIKPLIELVKGLHARDALGAKGKDSALKSLTIGLIGHPNVGKSSVINTLKRSKACPVAPTPGFTKHVQEVTLEKGIRLLDCPGVVVESRNEAAAALSGTLRAEELTDVRRPVSLILERCRHEHLMMLYSIPAFDPADETDFLRLVARAKGRLRRGGVPDLEGTAKSVIRDWVSGRIPYYTVAPAAPAGDVDMAEANDTSASAPSAPAEMDTDTIEQSTLHTSLAPAFNIDALFGEADAVAFKDIQYDTTVKVAQNVTGDESDGEAEAAFVGEEDEIDVEDLIEEDSASEAEEEDPIPQLIAAAPKKPGTKGKKALSKDTLKKRMFEDDATEAPLTLNKDLRKKAKKDKKKRTKADNEIAAEFSEFLDEN